MGTNPFLRVRDSSQKATFWASAALTIATMTALLVLGAPLRTSEAPWGIVSFELAGHLANSEMILASWDPTAKVSAGANLGLDYLFIVAYTVAIGLGCVLVAGGLAHNGRQWGHAGIFLSWGTILAGALDSVENYALIRLLLGSKAEILPVVARFCAIPKFVLVFLALFYVIVGALAWLVLARGRKSAA